MKKIRHSIPDVERYERQGFPEAVYCPGKTVEQITKIAAALSKRAGAKDLPPVLCTRADRKVYLKLKKRFPSAEYNAAARMIIIGSKARNARKSAGYVCVVTAGTSDIPAAEEAAATCEALGARVERVYDAGVAGVHRLFRYAGKITGASCVVVAAGMEGALPSIVGGIAPCPVIGLPTSVGYGANFGGVSALLTMLNSCAANVCTVNIDDGYGAGVIAYLIAKTKYE
jgi:hypothetical protein